MLCDAFAGGAEGCWLITFEGVTKRYADGTIAVDNLDLDVPDGKTMVLVGPSGCGKTTTLRMINRLVEPSQGRILLNGDDIRRRIRLGCAVASATSSSRRGCSRTARLRTTSPPCRCSTVAPGEGPARARELLTIVGLDPALAKRYPHQLSGGQQQRVGVARALAADPPALRWTSRSAPSTRSSGVSCRSS